MVKLIENKNRQYTVTIPRDAIEALGWEKGENLYIGKAKGADYIFIEKKGGENI